MKILILCSGSMGHYNGIQSLVKNIGLEAQYEIMYAFHKWPSGTNHPQWYALPSYPAMLNYEYQIGQGIREVIRLKANHSFLLHRIQSFKDLFKTFSPDVILLDNHAYTDGLILLRHFSHINARLILFQTRLSTELSPSSTYGSHLRNRFQYLPSKTIRRRQWKERVYNRLISPGYSMYREIEKYMVDLNIELNMDRFGLASLRGIPEILVSGSDLSKHRTSNQVYTGLNIKQCSNQNKIKNKILINTGSRIFKLKYINEFWSVLGKIIFEQKDLLFTVPESMKPTINGVNVSYYSWDTYNLHLRSASAVITHGGINSIKDALSTLTPMLICPLDWTGDQIHNSMIFSDLGLSETWNILQEDEATILAKIRDLIQGKSIQVIKNYITQTNLKYPIKIISQEFLDTINDDQWKINKIST